MTGNGRSARPYVYQGARPDQGEPWEDDRCGSYAGLQVHRRLGEDPCQPCLDAGAAYVQQWRLRTGRTRSVRMKVTPQLLALLNDR